MHMLDPLNRISESGKLQWLINELQDELTSIQQKNANNRIKVNTDILEQKITMLVEISEYHFQLYELAFQLNNSAFRAEQRLSGAIVEFKKLQKENQELKKGL